MGGGGGEQGFGGVQNSWPARPPTPPPPLHPAVTTSGPAMIDVI